MYWILIIWITGGAASPTVVPVTFFDEQSCLQSGEAWKQPRVHQHGYVCIPINGDLK